jgi:hypothetical protein
VQTWLQKVVSLASVTPNCPRCHALIPSEDVNVAKDIAFCRPCNLSHELSGLTTGEFIDLDVDLRQPPRGAWFRQYGIETVIGASHRSLGGAIALFFFSLFWNGIVSVFVFLTALSTLKHLGVQLPSWVSSLMSKSTPMPLAMTIFFWLFLTPFILIGLGLVIGFLSSLGGRTELRLQGNDVVLFSGIGPIGLRKRFRVSDVKSVKLESKRWRDTDGGPHQNSQIVIEKHSGKPLRFGSGLHKDRRRFLAAAVKKTLNA